MSFTVYARGDSASANNASINSQGTSTTPTTTLTFSADPAAGTDGDILLEYNGGGSDPDTLMFVDGVPTTFTVEFSGLLPTAQKLSNINGFDMRGEEVVVVTDDTTGQRYYFLTNSGALFADDAEAFATMDAMPNGALAITSENNTTTITICFAKGTRLNTPTGPTPIENLAHGDLVTTATGSEKILWIGSRHVSFAELLCAPSLRPIRFAANALGKGCPERDVVLSPNHRVVVNDWRLELNFGLKTSLIAAKHLVDGVTIQSFLPTDGVTYFHILLEGHHIVTSDGLPSESLLAGDCTLSAVSPDSRKELLHLFPEQFARNATKSVLPELARYESQILA